MDLSLTCLKKIYGKIYKYMYIVYLYFRHKVSPVGVWTGMRVCVCVSSPLFGDYHLLINYISSKYYSTISRNQLPKTNLTTKTILLKHSKTLDSRNRHGRYILNQSSYSYIHTIYMCVCMCVSMVFICLKNTFARKF